MDALHDGTLYGSPVQEAAYDHPQTQNYDCVEMSAADVIAQLTGQVVSEDDITNEAASLQSGFDTSDVTGQPVPMYDPNSGTDLRDTPALLANYGVHATYTDDTTATASGAPGSGMDVLTQQLANGNHVIASVDAPMIWNAIGVPNDVADNGTADHALVVTGVDTTAGVVYVNDSGAGDQGADEAIPISVFEQAWATSGHAMVTADSTTAQATVDPLDAPGPAFSTINTDYTFSPFGSHLTGPDYADPFSFNQSGPFGSDNSALIAAGGGAIAAVAAATMLHPRTRAVIASTISRARNR